MEEINFADIFFPVEEEKIILNPTKDTKQQYHIKQ